jgi:hypothetical protein
MRFGGFADPGFFVGLPCVITFLAREQFIPKKIMKTEQKEASELCFWLSVLQPITLSLYRSTET